MRLRFIGYTTDKILGEYECHQNFPIPAKGDVIETNLNEEYSYCVDYVKRLVNTFDMVDTPQIVMSGIDIYVSVIK